MNTVRLPNGVLIPNVPEGTSQEEIIRLAVNAGYAAPDDFPDWGSFGLIAVPKQSGGFRVLSDAEKRQYETERAEQQRAKNPVFNLAESIAGGFGNLQRGVTNLLPESLKMQQPNFVTESLPLSLRQNILGGALTTEQERIGAQNDAQRQAGYRKAAFPAMSTMAEMVGESGPFIPLAPARTALQTLLRLAGVSALEGGVLGASTAEPDAGAADTYSRAGIGAVTGGLLGPAAAFGSKYMSQAGGVLGDYLFNRGTDMPEKQSSRVLNAMFDTADITPEEAIIRKQELGPVGVLADTDEAIRQWGGPAIREPSGARSRAKAFIDDRARGQQQRMDEAIGLDIGAEPGNLRQMAKIVESRRAAEAAPYYREAYASDFQPTDVIETLLEAPDVQRAYKMAQRDIENRVATVKSRIAISDMTPEEAALELASVQSPVALLDMTKRKLDDMIGKAQRSGEKAKVKDLVGLRNAMVDQIDQAVPAYARARKIYADESALLEAGELGRKILREDADAMDDLVSRMGDSELEMFRAGAADAIRERMARTVESGNRTRVMRTPLYRERMMAAFPDEESFDNFMKRIEDEQSFSETARQFYNSDTQLRQRAEEAYQGKALPESLQQVATGQRSELIADTVQKLFRSKVSDQGKEQIADLLFSPETTLEQLRFAMNQNEVPKNVQQWIERKVAPYLSKVSAPLATSGAVGALEMEE